MDLCNFILKFGSGKQTTLDKEYIKLVNDIILGGNEESSARWEVYNIIIKDLLKIDGGLYFHEIRYRFTDGENPNDVLLDIISRYDISDLSSMVIILRDRLMGYSEDDFYSRFY